MGSVERGGKTQRGEKMVTVQLTIDHLMSEEDVRTLVGELEWLDHQEAELKAEMDALPSDVVDVSRTEASRLRTKVQDMDTVLGQTFRRLHMHTNTQNRARLLIAHDGLRRD